ncbi:MAG: SDR family oxidoreductase [Planctomycetota bacterium]
MNPRADPSTLVGRSQPCDTDRPVALVTGGAKRVGAAICHALARAGCDLIVTYNSSSAEAIELQTALERNGVGVQLEKLDLSKPDHVSDVAGRLATDLPRLDVLVHNASIYKPTALNEVNEQNASEHFTVNALAPVLLTQRLAGRLAESPLPGGGAIIAMADIHVLGLPRRKFLSYSMSKAALVEMVRVLARELAPRVRVNGVAPGVVQWPDEGYESDTESQQRYLRRVPAERAGTPEEAAEAVRWLAMQATYTTGQILRIDGGRSLT